MKLPFTVFLAALLAFAPGAQGAQAAQSNNVIIVNGKKFFLLSNARHFTAGPNNPSALNVMHHPRPPVRPVRPMAAANATAGAPQAIAKPASEGASDVLSLFSPDEKATTPASTAIKQ